LCDANNSAFRSTVLIAVHNKWADKFFKAGAVARMRGNLENGWDGDVFDQWNVSGMPDVVCSSLWSLVTVMHCADHSTPLSSTNLELACTWDLAKFPTATQSDRWTFE
jgi:hypothetical protein